MFCWQIVQGNATKSAVRRPDPCRFHKALPWWQAASTRKTHVTMCKSSKDLIFIQLQWHSNVASKSPVLRCGSKVQVPLAPFSFLSYLSPLNKKHTSTNVCRKGRFFWVLFCPGVLSVDYDFFLAYQDVNWRSLHLLKGVFLVAPLHFTVFGNLLCFDMEVLVSNRLLKDD